MTIRVIRKADLAGTARHVKNDADETTRFLLDADRADATVTDIVIAPGIEAEYGDDKHIEIAYRIEGAAVPMDDAAGQTHRIEPGTMWVARKGARFRFRAGTPTRLICVFSPPFAGRETGFAGDQ
ncbi:MAG: ectoine synthase [Alphaproteobacteria bacterium]|nr:ectoine synthase [Alphaproteobacteria bacterium]